MQSCAPVQLSPWLSASETNPHHQHLSHVFLVQMLDYGVSESNILGIRYGFRGFYDRAHKPVTLTRR